MMMTRRFHATDMRQALRQIQQTMGDQAVIVTERTLPDGTVEVEAMAESTISLDAPVSTLPPFSPAATTPDLLQNVYQELATLRHLVRGSTHQAHFEADTSRQFIAERLSHYGLSSAVIKLITPYLDIQLTPAALWQQALEKLESSITLSNEDILEKGGIYALLGATGVGKSTTIAKLATHFVLRHGAESIALISTDYFKLGANEQFTILKKILNVDCYSVNTPNEMRGLLETLTPKFLILIDTAGIGSRDQVRLQNQLEILKVHDNIGTLLALAANSEQHALQDSIQLFQQTAIRGTILTKMDECVLPGPILSSLISARLPLSYLSDGQRIPLNLQVASAQGLLAWLFAGDKSMEASMANRGGESVGVTVL